MVISVTNVSWDDKQKCDCLPRAFWKTMKFPKCPWFLSDGSDRNALGKETKCK